MSTSRRSIVSFLAATTLVLVLAVPALAHAELKTSDPEDKAVLATPPTVITLTFTEGLDQAKSSFKLNGPAGTVGTGKPVKQGGKVMTLEDLVIAPGAYSIQWTAAATDGHVERGTLSFSVLEPTPVPATPSPTPVPSVAAPSEAPATASAAPATPPATTPAVTPVAPSASPVSGDDAAPASASGMDVLLPIVLGLVIVGGLGAFLVRRNRKA